MDTTSDISDLSSDDGRPYRTRRILPVVPVSQQTVDRLTGDLQETTRNIRAVDTMLDQYKDVSDQHSSAIDKLREDLSRTTTQLKEERENRRSISDTRSLRSSDLDRYSDTAEARRSRRKQRKPTSPIRDYRRRTSDEEYTGYPRSRRKYGGRSRTSSVRFREDLNTSIHDLHQSLRDLTSDQIRLQEELGKEAEQRRKSERENRRALRDMSTSLKQNQIPATLMVSSRVDDRLKKLEDEFQTKRKLREQKDEISHLSTELKQALHHLQQPAVPPPPPDTSRLDRLERDRIQAEHELKSTRRKLDQSEGSKSALESQIAQLRGQLSRVEEDKQVFRQQMETMKREEESSSRRKRRAVDESEDRLKLEKEVQQLRAELSRASGAGELGDLRRELDKSERQRTQLSDHIEVLSKDLDNKEKHAAKLTIQLREDSNRQQECEEKCAQLTKELEDAMRKQRDVTREAQKYANELTAAENEHQEHVKRNEELKARAQEVVKQWKAKCKKLERELDRQQHTAQQAQTRVEQLIKENETVKNLTQSGSQTLENMRREMADILSVRAQQEEQISGRDLQISELKSTQASLEIELSEAKQVIEQMENELRSYQQRFHSMNEDRNKLDEAISATQAAERLSQDQNRQLQRQLAENDHHSKELSEQLRKSEIQNQELKNKLQDIKRSLNESRRNETVAKKDIEDLALQVKELKQSHLGAVENLKREINSSTENYKQRLTAAQNQEEKTKQDLLRRIKHEQADYEAQLQALQIQLSDERSSSKLVKRQVEKSHAEIERLHTEISRLEAERNSVKLKYQRVRQEYDTKSASAEEDMSRVRQLQEELQSLQDVMKRSEREQQSLLQSVGLEIQTVVELAAVDASDKLQAMSPLKTLSSDRSRWLSAVQKKLQWLRTNIRERQEQKRKYKIELREAVAAGNKEKNVLVTELGRQKQVADSLVSKAEALDFLGRKKEAEVESLEEQVLSLTDQLETVREESMHQSFERDREKQDILHELNKLKESDTARNRIHERYNKLQLTVSALKQELSDATKLAKDNREDRLESELHAAQLASLSPLRVSQRYIATPPTRDISSDDRYPAHRMSHGGDSLDLSDIEPPDLTTHDLATSKSQTRSDKRSRRERTNSGILRSKNASEHNSRDKSTVRFSPSTYKREYLSQATHSASDSVLSTTDNQKDSLFESAKDAYEHRVSSSTKGDRTPPPLSLSDDEFRKKFITRTPPLSDNDDY